MHLGKIKGNLPVLLYYVYRLTAYQLFCCRINSLLTALLLYSAGTERNTYYIVLGQGSFS